MSPNGRAQGEVGEDREAELLVEHVGLGADDVAELRVPAQRRGVPADVDAARPVAAAVEAVGPERPGAPLPQPEIAAASRR